MYAALVGTIDQGQRDKEFREVDSIHVANILSGVTIWLTGGADPMGGGEESRTDRLARYRDELAGVARYLLGTPSEDEKPEQP
jgi:hypothetical protein